MATESIRIDRIVLSRVMERKPHYLSATGFVSQLLEKALDGPNTMAESPTGGRSLLINKEEERVRVREGLTPQEEEKAPKPAWEKEIPAHLHEHSDLIRDFFRTKKGSKGQRAWKLLMTELTKIQEGYGHEETRRQIELAINGCWQSITLANFERFKPKQKLPSQSYDGSTIDWEALNNAPVL